MLFAAFLAFPTLMVFLLLLMFLLLLSFLLSLRPSNTGVPTYAGVLCIHRFTLVNVLTIFPLSN
jgi:hypothetical protein